ncbi:MAG: bifunctional phosphopantothenoylcysteine decarboxylase/phosphopantothenate--cysteine ligase CoaBC [Bacteroidota bacterium]|nr:bifunctional phosphopantothenoylcysteine decarboxylase/phosphopantothenate--cysteine ligase CoaBC [Bacteroidota bacterium]
MSVLKDKKILLGVTGGIAAYKTAFLVRLLVKEGAEVQVIMTDDAKEFITPLTLATLSKREVYSTFYENQNNGKWNNHVDLGLWADILLIAPATANTIAKMANGICDNLLLAVYFSSRSKVYLAPAMDLDMYKHPTITANISKLQSYSNIVIPAQAGELASGLYGVGRMAEPEDIVFELKKELSESLILKDKKVIVTAGPTYEAIDPVRFIGNYSSGKMGFEIAQCLAEKGAEVTLISGPTSLEIRHQNINRINVRSASEMYDQAHQIFDQVNIVVAAAAVADYRPKNIAQQKIKKNSDTFVLELEKNKDILADLGKRKTNQILVGFALETQNEIDNAISKIKRKNLDFIVLNSLNDSGAGFGTDTNKITIIDKDLNRIDFDLKSKKEVAQDIVNKITENYE